MSQWLRDGDRVVSVTLLSDPVAAPLGVAVMVALIRLGVSSSVGIIAGAAVWHLVKLVGYGYTAKHLSGDADPH